MLAVPAAQVPPSALHIFKNSRRLFTALGLERLSHARSLNSVNNPDRDTAGTSVYYAHPYVMRSGETMASVRHRFAITDEHIGLLNNKKTVFVPGETICIVPMWKKAVDSNGAYVCDATADRMRIAGNLDVLNMSDSTGSSAGLSEMEAQAGKVSYVVT